MTRGPAISVVIPTCNRPTHVMRCLGSLCSVHYPFWDALVLDQSADARTETIVQEFAKRLPNLAYRRMDAKGISRARNLAMRTTVGDILAFLDDDCTVDRHWLDRVAASFARNPEVDLIFGRVVAAPHDSTTLFVPSYEVPKERILRGRIGFLRIGPCMGASMYVRHPLITAGIPYDVAISMGEDRDYVYRVLAEGYAIMVTPAIVVLHFGGRDYAGGVADQRIRDGVYSWGALDMKYLRSADIAMAVLIPAHFLGCLLAVDFRRAFLRPRGSRIGWPIFYIRGLIAGVHRPVVRRHRLWEIDEPA
ncbi:MAG: hypothetical protein NVSMB52_15130 [Chloroflexota bacterium]